VGEGAEIEAGAAHHDGWPAARGDLGQGLRRCRQPPTDRPAVGRVGDAEQVMRRLGQFVARRPGRQHRQAGIDLHGVGVDDLATGLARHRQGQGGLAAGGWPGDKDDLCIRQSRVESFSGLEGVRVIGDKP